jgi:hypothetical protein
MKLNSFTPCKLPGVLHRVSQDVDETSPVDFSGLTDISHSFF